MRSPILLAVVAVASLATLTACSSSGNGNPEPDTVSLPADLQTTSGPAPVTSTTPADSNAPVNSPSLVPTSSSPAVVIHAAPSTPTREATVTSPDGKTTYVIKVWAETTSSTCANRAYGTPIIQYLNAHPCAGLSRLLATTVVGGRPVGFAQSSLGFTGSDPDVYEVAGKFAQLEDENGTGSIDDLFMDGYRLPSGPSSLPSPDAFDVESQDSGVTIVDAFYLDGKTPNNAPALIQMAKDIYLQF